MSNFISIFSILKKIINIFGYLITYGIKYAKLSSSIKYDTNINKLKYRISAHCHVIEKGLSLKYVKKNFGQKNIKSLINLIKKYELLGGDNSILINRCKDTLYEYYTFNNKPNELEYIKDFLGNYIIGKFKTGGTKEICANKIIEKYKGDFKVLAEYRASIRNFLDEKIDIEIIYNAIELSKNHPSSCNRQPNKVIIVKNKEKKEIICKLQSGNRGFGEYVDTYIIVLTDLNGYIGYNEAFSPYVDGGIYLMNLLYSLSYYGIGTCILNWSVSNKIDRQLKKELCISNNYIIIGIIALGYTEDKIKVAYSQKNSKNELIIKTI